MTRRAAAKTARRSSQHPWRAKASAHSVKLVGGGPAALHLAGGVVSWRGPGSPVLGGVLRLTHV
eukprot:2676177-Alexandrium_andersonii.AAC.1